MTHRYGSGAFLMLHQVAGLSTPNGTFGMAMPMARFTNDITEFCSIYKRRQTLRVSFIGDLSSAVVTGCGRKISVSRHKTT